FFSSRRRHTRSKRDWSSDVCSSDLNAKKAGTDPDTISFSFGYPSKDAYPIDTLRQISDNLYENEEPDSYLQYGQTEGVPELRGVLKERLAKTIQLQTAEDLIITSGAKIGRAHV